MKILKPQKLGVFPRPFSSQGRCYLAIGVFVYFPVAPATGMLTEASMWKRVAEELGDAVLDLGMPKSRGEFLIDGRACTSGARPQKAVQVRVRLGTKEKRLRVTGDRYWQPDTGGVSDIRAFTEMPVDWAHAYGGPGYALNPLGKGQPPGDAGATGAAAIQWLPNVEALDRGVCSPDDTPAPAGFRAYDAAWPQRARKTGARYDGAWLETLFPGPAADFDWTYYNMAPEDQWLEGFFAGDEAYEIEGMHPSRELITGRLPGLQCRAFIRRRPDQDGRPEGLTEVATRLETVRFFPHAERGILLYRGVTEVAEDDASDVLQLLVACEHRDAPKPVEHYESVYRRRMDPERGVLAALRESDLLPADSRVNPPEVGQEDRSDMEDVTASEDLLRKNLKRRQVYEAQQLKERYRAAGIDPATLFTPENDPSLETDEEPAEVDPENLPEQVERDIEELRAREAEARQRGEEVKGHARAAYAAIGLDYDAAMLQNEAERAGPPKKTARQEIEEIRAAAMEANGGEAIPAIEAMLNGPKAVAALEESDRQARDTYRRTAHLGTPARRATGEHAARLRACVVEARAQGQGLAGADLTGADLRGLDLRAMDFTESFLEAACLADATLAGARFDRAVLAGADLTGSAAQGASFVEANLGGATFARADLQRADLTGAILARASLEGGSFVEARMEGADLREAVLRGADLRGVQAPKLLVLEAELTGADFSEANLNGATFMKCKAPGVKFCGAQLARATFAELQAEGANFRGASAENLRVVLASTLAGANFVEARLEAATLRGTKLADGDFSMASLVTADLSECDLARARFYHAVAREARFVRADLTDAVLIGANLMESQCAGAEITRADFSGANLFRADFGRVRGKARSTLDALTTRLLVVPRRQE